MGKHTSRSSSKPSAPSNRNTVNPYMRGIGCLFMLIVPVFSYGVGYELADKRFGAQVIPPGWYGRMEIPPALYALTGLRGVFNFLEGIPNLPATLALAVVVGIIIGGILSIIFGWMYSVLAPSKYGPMDVPAPRVKTKKYKR